MNWHHSHQGFKFVCSYIDKGGLVCQSVGWTDEITRQGSYLGAAQQSSSSALCKLVKQCWLVFYLCHSHYIKTKVFKTLKIYLSITEPGMQGVNDFDLKF
jgi:hypothetical protein